MALVSLALLNTLRPWHDAGLYYFLFSDSLVPSDFTPIEESLGDCIAGGQQKTPLESPTAVECRKPHAGMQSSFAVSASEFSTESIPSRQLATKPTQSLNRDLSADSPQEKTGSHSFEFLPLENWPMEWQVLYHKTKPAPIVWTYAELGEDLTGDGCQKRAAHLRQLIGSLRLPKGSSVFWPSQLPALPIAIDDSIFYSGLCLLAPKVCISLGSGAAGSFPYAFPSCRPFTQHIAEGRLHIFLPDFGTLLLSKQATQQASVYLSSALSAFPTLLSL